MPESFSVDIARLAASLRAKRGTKGLRVVAKDIGGVSASTLSRIEQGKLPDLDTFGRICNWLGVPADDFLTGRNVRQQAATSTPEFVEAHLRADRVLAPKTIDALAQMIRLAYDAAHDGRIGRAKN